MTCANCGQVNRAGARFCDACGAALVAPAEAAVARKVVTIVFADLVGSTALHERLDAESARAMMDRYYTALHGAVAAHGGTVVKLLGDGVMAAFGVPRVAEDDALRAVRAAAAMVEAVRQLGHAAAPPADRLAVRVAVNTGEVVVSADQTDVVGDPVNVAARLQQAAQDGDVLLGESTRRLVGDLVTLAPVGALALRGRSESVAAHRLVSLARPGGAAAAPFVGRDDELRRLLALHAEAVRARRPRLAVVLGSPGLGKSRLLSEVERRLAAGALVLAARCEAAGGATFAPLAEALRAHLGIADAADAAVLRAAVEAALPDDGERARVAAGVAALLAGAPAAPEETFFVVRRLLAALAARQPLLLVIDDVQWAEPLLLDLVEHLVQWSTEAPLLVLLAARPELRELRPALAASGRMVREVVTLAGLDAGAATRLAANVIGADELPAAIAGRVLATSEGNPLFVGELVRMLVQDGALTREGDRWTAGVEVAALEMPPTIHALLAARIERLRPEQRTVLERAAVVGRSFSRAAVAALLPAESTAALDGHLQALRRSELIEPDPAPYLGELGLRFHHMLIRDAAYRQLLKGTRAELHERLADWIAARGGAAGEHDEMIGWHLEQAHQHRAELGPLDAAGRALGSRAAHHLAAAGRRALSRDDLSLAATLLGRAIARLEADDAGRADLALDWCEALLAAGDVGQAAIALAALERFAATTPRLRAWHTCFAGQLAVLTAPQGLRATAAAVAAAAETLVAAGDAAGEAKAHAVHATALVRLGAIGASEAALDKALAAARRAGDRRRASAVLAGAPLAALWGPSPVTRASGRCLDVVRVLRITQGAPAVEAVALRCQAVLEALRGRTDAARRMIAASRRLVEELGITHRLLEADVFAGMIALLEGDAVGAERSLRPAYEGLRAQGLGIDAARAASLLASAVLAQGRVAEAETLSHECEALAGDDLQAAIAWRGVRAEALARRGEHAEAVALARAAVDIAAATDALLDHADARQALAIALRAAGREAEADAEAARAVELWDAKGAVVLSERARAVAGQPVGTPPPPVPAVPARRRVRPNAATLHVARFDEAARTRDLAAFLALLADGADAIHHPTQTAYLERELANGYATLFGAEALAFHHEPLATLGERLALCRGETSFTSLSFQSANAVAEIAIGAASIDSLVLAEVDGDGRRIHTEFFAHDRLGDAMARLYTRYADSLPDGGQRRAAAGTADAIAAFIGPLDLAAIRRVIAPDIAYADRRRIGFPAGCGAEAYLRGLGSLLDVFDRVERCATDVLAARPDVVVMCITASGIDRAGGGATESRFCQLLEFGADGRVTRSELFDEDRAADALAAAGAVGPSRPGPGRVENAALRTAERMREAALARDADAFRDLLAPQFRSEDRQAVVRLELGREEWLSAGHAMLDDLSILEIRHQVLATRGDRLSLMRVRWTVGGETVGHSELDWLELLEVGPDGRAVGWVAWDPDDLDAAYAELDARYATGESAPFDLVTTAMVEFRRALASRDWQALAAVLSPDLIMHDHRPLGWEATRGPQPYIDALRALVELAPDVRLRLDHADICANGYLALSTWVGAHEGGVFETPSYIVGELDAAGRARRFDQYDLDQLPEAQARWAALKRGATPVVPRPATVAIPPNAATRAMDRWIAATAAGDGEALGALFAPDALWEDRRRLSRMRGGRDEAIANGRFIARANVIFTRSRLSSSGTRLAIEHVRFARPDGDLAFELEALQLVEVDAEGRIVAAMAFDVDARRAAAAEMFARFARGEGATVLAPNTLEVAQAILDHDLVALRAALRDDFVFDDHRHTGVGRIEGADAYVDSLRALFALSPDLAIETLYEVARGPGAYLVVARMFGTLAAGGDFETVIVRLQIERDGRFAIGELFELDDLERARERFDAVCRSAPASPGNAATRMRARLRALFAAGDWATLRALAAPGFVYDDRRHWTQFSGGVDFWIQSMRTTRQADVLPSYELIAAFGDRLAVERTLWRGQSEGGPIEVEYVSITEVDADGRLSWSVNFDPDERELAIAEARARFAARG